MLGAQRVGQQKNEFFKELKFHEWKVYPAISSEDIVWQNVENLMQRSKFAGVMGYVKPIIISTLAILSLLSLESLALHYLPWISSIIVYVTTTLLVLFCFYATPYLVFNSVQKEKLAQKSHREILYMRRLVVTEILNVFILPIVYNVLLIVFAQGDHLGQF